MENSTSLHPSTKEADFLTFWGKSREVDGGLIWHPAAFHMLDVAAVAQTWLAATRPYIPGLGVWSEQSGFLVAALIALHDVGKFSGPFQGKVEALWPTALGPHDPRPAPRHDTAGYALLCETAIPTLSTLKTKRQRALWRAVCGHHGRPPSEDRIDSRTFGQDSPVGRVSRAAAMAFINAVWDLLNPAPLPELSGDEVTAFSWWLAGLTVLADWVGSAEDWFPYTTPEMDLAAYWRLARQRAERAVKKAGLLPAIPAERLDYGALIGPHPPTPLQRFVARMPLPQGPALILIEDQMGSGKTEAALMLAHRLMQSHGAAGLFVALPTMATANALYARLGQAKDALFAAESMPSLALVHGKSRLVVAHDADETASAQCAAWIGDDRRRSFLAALGAGTIDQAVLSVLPSRHAPLRLFGLSQRTLIIDEAHAYDDYVTEELSRLIAFQARQGGSAIVLSATLPRQTRQKLLRAFGNEMPCQQEGYPLVTVASPTTLEEHAVLPRPDLARALCVHRLSDMDAALVVVRAAAARGAAVGWVRNTVDEAMAAQTALAGEGIDATLFHARFAMGDRLAIEAEVQDRFGKTGMPERRAHVVVGTQVMEQSLDLDFDVLISDLAPVDLLLQRAGRLWRHQRGARREAEPCLYIISPEPVTAPDKTWLQNFRGTAAVYRDPALLWRSCCEVFSRPVLNLPADVRPLVEAVYAPDAEVPEGLAAQSALAGGKGAAARGVAWQNLLDWDKGYASGVTWTSEVATPTRLTDPSFAYRLAVWANGVLTPLCTGKNDWAMSEITLPARKVKTAPEETGARYNALKALRAGWSRWEQELPVLIVEPDGNGYRGEVINQQEKRQKMWYDRRRGFRLGEF